MIEESFQICLEIELNDHHYPHNVLYLNNFLAIFASTHDFVLCRTMTHREGIPPGVVPCNHIEQVF